MPGPVPGNGRGPNKETRSFRHVHQGLDYLLQRLREWGVDHVFGYPGDGINGLLAAWGRADNQPRFVQSRHEEMSAFEAVGYAKFTGRVGVCAATSGPGRDPPAQRPVRRQARPRAGGGDRRPDRTARAMGGSYQQEVDLLSLFKDVASDFVRDGDRPRAAAERPGPGDPHRVRPPRPDRGHHPRGRAGARLLAARPTRSRWCRPASDRSDCDAGPGRSEYLERAAEILNAGEKVAILIGQGARRRAGRGRADRRPARRGRRQGAARQGRAAATTCRTSPARSACWARARRTS